MQKYGLIGYPLGHSFSKNYFNQKFESENIDATYLNFEIPNIKDLKTVLKDNPELNGLNVTIPYKEQVIPYLDDLDERPPDRSRQRHQIYERHIRQKTERLQLRHHRLQALHRTAPERDTSQSLDPGNGWCVKSSLPRIKTIGCRRHAGFRKPKSTASPEEITPKTMQQYTVIVNTTPLGMYPNINACPDIPYDLLTPDHLLYDLLYNPDETLFMKKGKEKGAVVKNGLEMLLLQAFAAWEIWQK